MIDPPNPEVAEEELRKRKQREEERKKRKAKVGIYVMVSLLLSDSSLSSVFVLLSVSLFPHSPSLSLSLPLPPSLPLPQLARYREKVREQQRTGREQTNILEIYQHMTSVRRAIQGAENILEEYLVSSLFKMINRIIID